MSDYRLLEEVLTESDRVKRWKPEYIPGSEAAARSDRPPAAARTIALLINQARGRGKAEEEEEEEAQVEQHIMFDPLVC